MTQPLPVTGADREAAAEFIISRETEQMVRSGHADSQPLVQAFARHRLASTPSTGAVPEGMREALERVKAAYEGAARHDSLSGSFRLADIALLFSPAQVPATREGWVCVPIEPTDAMCEAWANASAGSWIIHLPDEEANALSAKADWSAMLAAAPKAESSERLK